MRLEILANFVAELTKGQPIAEKSKKNDEEQWMLIVDRSLNSRSAGLGVLSSSPWGESFKQLIKLGFHALNNEAEYEALINRVQLARSLGLNMLRILSNS